MVGDDDPETSAVAQRAARRHPDMIRVVLDTSRPKNKPKALNAALPACRGDVVGVFDAEDEVHPQLLRHVDARFEETGADVVQGGVQLMNYHSNWYSVRNVLEYYFWFRSRLHFHAAQRFIPLGGNTVFVRADLLRQAGGWDPDCLAEDCELGVRLSSGGPRSRSPTTPSWSPARRPRPPSGPSSSSAPAGTRASSRCCARASGGGSPPPASACWPATPWPCRSSRRSSACWSRSRWRPPSWLKVPVLAALITFMPLSPTWPCWSWRPSPSASSAATTASGHGCGTTSGCPWERRRTTRCCPWRRCAPSSGSCAATAAGRRPPTWAPTAASPPPPRSIWTDWVGERPDRMSAPTRSRPTRSAALPPPGHRRQGRPPCRTPVTLHPRPRFPPTCPGTSQTPLVAGVARRSLAQPARRLPASCWSSASSTPLATTGSRVAAADDEGTYVAQAWAVLHWHYVGPLHLLV